MSKVVVIGSFDSNRFLKNVKEVCSVKPKRPKIELVYILEQCVAQETRMFDNIVFLHLQHLNVALTLLSERLSYLKQLKKHTVGLKRDWNSSKSFEWCANKKEGDVYVNSKMNLCISTNRIVKSGKLKLQIIEAIRPEIKRKELSAT